MTQDNGPPTTRVFSHTAVTTDLIFDVKNRVALFEFLTADNETALVTVPLHQVERMYRKISEHLRKAPELFAPE